MRLLIVIAFAVIGFALGALIGEHIAPGFGFPNREGSSAIFAVLFAGPCGAIAGGALGLVLSNKFAGDARTTKILAAGSWIGIAAVIVGSLMYGEYSTSDRLSRGSVSKMAYELRLPFGIPPPASGTFVVELRTDKNVKRGEIFEVLPRREDDRAVIRGTVELYYATPNRTIALRIAEGPTYLFTLRMPARPKSSPGFYEDWFPVDLIDDNVPGKPPRVPSPNETAEIRYFQTVYD